MTLTEHESKNQHCLGDIACTDLDDDPHISIAQLDEILQACPAD